jgi:hypothetical protein
MMEGPPPRLGVAQVGPKLGEERLDERWPLAIATAVLERNMFDATRQWIGPLARLKFKHSDLSILERGIGIQLRKVSFLISKVAFKLYESKTRVRNSRTSFYVGRTTAGPKKPIETAICYVSADAHRALFQES